MFADTFGSERRLGVMFTTSYNQTHKPRDSRNIAWEETPATDRPNYFYMTNYGEDGLKHTRGGTGLRSRMARRRSGSVAALTGVSPVSVV